MRQFLHFGVSPVHRILRLRHCPHATEQDLGARRRSEFLARV